MCLDFSSFSFDPARSIIALIEKLEVVQKWLSNYQLHHILPAEDTSSLFSSIITSSREYPPSFSTAVSPYTLDSSGFNILVDGRASHLPASVDTVLRVPDFACCLSQGVQQDKELDSSMIPYSCSFSSEPAHPFFALYQEWGVAQRWKPIIISDRIIPEDFSSSISVPSTSFLPDGCILPFITVTQERSEHIHLIHHFHLLEDSPVSSIWFHRPRGRMLRRKRCVYLSL